MISNVNRYKKKWKNFETFIKFRHYPLPLRLHQILQDLLEKEKKQIVIE